MGSPRHSPGKGDEPVAVPGGEAHEHVDLVIPGVDDEARVPSR